METQDIYVECSRSDIPDSVRWDVPPFHQGQHIEVAYGGWDASPHDRDAPYKRVHDRSFPAGQGIAYYCRLEPDDLADLAALAAIADAAQRPQDDRNPRRVRLRKLGLLEWPNAQLDGWRVTSKGRALLAERE